MPTSEMTSGNKHILHVLFFRVIFLWLPNSWKVSRKCCMATLIKYGIHSFYRCWCLMCCQKWQGETLLHSSSALNFAEQVHSIYNWHINELLFHLFCSQTLPVVHLMSKKKNTFNELALKKQMFLLTYSNG